MAQITIKDLPQSDELDRRSMLLVVGGARDGARPFDGGAPRQRADRIVDYPPGFRAPADGAGECVTRGST